MVQSQKGNYCCGKDNIRNRRMEKDMPSGKSVLALGKAEVGGNSERD